MTYRDYKLSLFVRIFVLFLSITIFVLVIYKLDFGVDVLKSIIIAALLLFIIFLSVRSIFKFTIRRYAAMDRFFESIKYRDFTQWFNEDSGPEDIRELHRGFNSINETIKTVNKEKEIQYLYLQKILELVNTGLIAYNIESGSVLWVND